MNTTLDSNNLYEGEAERFNHIANYLDIFADIIEKIQNVTEKENAKKVLSRFENAVLQSPEWIYKDGISGINLGIFGTPSSGWKEVLTKFLDNHYLEGIEEMGIRFKHVLKLSDKSKYLLLMRHERESIPDRKFCKWVDCGMFVFNLTNERSFKDALLSHKEVVSHVSDRSTTAPMVLVGCRDGISEETPRIKTFVEMKAIAQQYGFDEYIEVRHEEGYNIFFLFEFCTLIANKWKNSSRVLLRNENVPVLGSVIDIDSSLNMKKRKNIKRKTCIDEDFKTPSAPPQFKKVSDNRLPNAPRINFPPESPPNENNERHFSEHNLQRIDNGQEIKRRQSFNFFKSKNKSLPRPLAADISSSFSSSSDLSEQIYPKLNRRYVSMIQLPNKKSPWRFFHRKKGSIAKESFSDENVIMQGSLYKGRNKKWVTITKDAKMFYHKTSQEYNSGVCPKYIDLQFSNVKVPGNHSQNGHFSRATKLTRKIKDEEESKSIIINTHNGKSQYITRVYKAKSEEDRDKWMAAISDAIFHNYEKTKIDKKFPMQDSMDSVENDLSQIVKQFGNDKCAECDAKNPNWVVYNFGILVCDRCSGAHRNLGVEISKVCSLKLDALEKIRIQFLKSFGNYLTNSVMEARLPLTGDVKPTPETLSIDKWLQNKYVLRKYIPPLPLNCEEIQKQLVFAIQVCDRRYQLICIMNATKDQLNKYYDVEKDCRTALMIASRVADVVAVQMLLWAGVDTSIKDGNGLNALSFTSIILDNNEQPEDTEKLLEIQEMLKRFRTPIQRLCKTSLPECT